ncbi:MAG: hypothetical protein ACRDD7_14310 [Peptostreptococcaceae bacterium]
MKEKIGIALLVILAFAVFLTFQQEEVVKDVDSKKEVSEEVIEVEEQEQEVVEETMTYKDYKEELVYYEELLEGYIETINNDPMNISLAQDIEMTIKRKMPEMVTMNVDDKYKENLVDALTAVMMSMKEYQKGNLDKSVELFERAEGLYKAYKIICENS